MEGESMEIKNLRAEDIMKRQVISAKGNVSAGDIAMQLVSGPFSGMPVTDERGRVVGVVTEHDLLNQIRNGKELATLTAEDVMQKNPITVDVSAPLNHVLEIMLENGILRIPVTDQLSLVGIISRSDILRITVEQ